jgi:hypothetical protein
MTFDEGQSRYVVWIRYWFTSLDLPRSFSEARRFKYSHIPFLTERNEAVTVSIQSLEGLLWLTRVSSASARNANCESTRELIVV